MSMPHRKLRFRDDAADQPAAYAADAGGEHAGKADREAEPGQDASQVKQIQAEELQVFYQQNLGVIYRYVYSKVGNREEAEDITSQVFMKAVHGIDGGRGAEAMQRWLFQVARTTIADYWRARYRFAASSLEELLDAGWEGPAESEAAHWYSQPGERVQRILEALPEHYRQVLTCRFLFSLSVKETALSMGLSEANVKVLQFRALKRAADLDGVFGEALRS